jgi:hypothetical protein
MKLPSDGQNGIWLDYQKNTFLFFIRDRIWQKDEIRSAHHRDTTVAFVQEGIVDLFLLTIEDCLECSDIPFCIKDADEEMLQSLQKDQDYDWEFILVNEDGSIAFVRDGSFTHNDSMVLKKALAARLNENYTGADFDAAYAALAAKKEPFEMEGDALFTEVQKK